MKNLSIKEINNDKMPLGPCELQGWVKTHRQSKSVSFIELSDGSSLKGIQLVIEPSLTSYAAVAGKIFTGACLKIKGELAPSPAKGQKFEVKVSEVELICEADAETYPLQKKEISLEYLREVLHLRPRTNTFAAMARIRSVAAMGIHQYYQERGYYYLTAPIITSSDCEGAGAMFRVTTLDMDAPPKVNGKVNYAEDFFKESAFLTVSGQLEAEVYALAMTKVYTFGPTFRAENSNTSRHLAEFWMIEPEIAFCDLKGNMAIGEEFIRYIIKYVLDRCEDDLKFLHSRNEGCADLFEALVKLTGANFEVMDYTEAVKILENSKQKFEYPVKWGIDLQSEHERYITDQHVKGPVFVVNYPKEIKAFYMRLNEDGKTVRAMDVLVPRLGEIIGGSQREERHDHLVQRMKESNLPLEHYSWYLDLRRFGSAPHAGFGLGFERFLMYITGMQNIRDVIPFPRHPGFAKF